MSGIKRVINFLKVQNVNIYAQLKLTGLLLNTEEVSKIISNVFLY